MGFLPIDCRVMLNTATLVDLQLPCSRITITYRKRSFRPFPLQNYLKSIQSTPGSAFPTLHCRLSNSVASADFSRVKLYVLRTTTSRRVESYYC